MTRPRSEAARIRRFFLLTTAVLLLGPGAARAATDGSISGRVLDSAGDPVARARVLLFFYRSPEQELLDRSSGAEPQPIGQGRTDAHGAFRLAPPKAGEPVSLRILAAGLPVIEIAGPVDSGADEEDLEVSFPPAQRISGRITDETGKPVPLARIRASAPLEAPEDGLAFEDGSSGPDGAFTLSAAPKGDVTIRFSAPGFAALEVAGSKSGQRLVLKRGGGLEGAVSDRSGKSVVGVVVAAGGDAALTGEGGRFRFEALPEGLVGIQVLWKEEEFARRDGVRIRKGVTTRADLVLAAAPGISGVVLDEKTRRPLARVRVAAFLSRFTAPGVPPTRQARSDARGRFRLPGLLNREYYLTASRVDYLLSSLTATAASPPSGTVRIALVRGAAVSGKVTDESGSPVGGARVQKLAGTGRSSMSYVEPTRAAPSVLSRADGFFRLAGLPPGIPVSVLASREGFVSASRHGIAVGPSGGKPVILVLKRGLEARGRVVNGEGEAVSGAEVVLSRSEERRLPGGGSWSTETEGASRRAVTNAEGIFRLRALEPGNYSATIKHAAYARKTIAALEVGASGVTEWSPFVLTPSALVAGIVRNKAGEPIAGATVAASSADAGYEEAFTDAEGRFRQDGYSAGATVSLSVRAEGYSRATQSVTPPAVDLTVVLSPSSVIRGRVEDASSQQPVTSFSIRGRLPRGPSLEARDFRSEDGAFEIANVPAGKIDLTASAPGYLDGKIAGIEIGEGEVKEGVVLSLKKGQKISGRVLDPVRGAGVPNATVSWRRVSERTGSGIAIGPSGAFVMVANPATTDADGRFEYEAVPPEKLIFKATHPDYLEAEKTVDAASETALELTLSQGGSIAGTVFGSDGRSPVPGAEVNLLESGAVPTAFSGDQTSADEGGRFSFLHLKEGRYRLIARGLDGRSGKTEVVLAPGQSAEGVVLPMSAGALVRGKVTGLPPERLAGLEARAYSETFSGSAATGPDGRFTFSDVPPGVVLVAVSTARYGVSSRAVTKNVDVPENAAEVSVEIDFGGTSRLEVHVTQKDKLLAGVGLYVRPDLGAPGPQVGGETNAEGRAVLEGLEDGSYQLSGRWQGSINFQRLVTVSGDTSVDIALGRGSISGTVKEASSGEPLSDVSVAAETGQEATQWQVRRAQTDSQGYYTIDELDPGTFQVTARRDGYRQKTLPVTVGDSPAQLPFNLARGGGLPIVATDGLSGLPLSGLSVVAFSDSGVVAFSGAVALDSSGSGEIASLAPGRYAVYVNSAGYACRSINPVQVPSPPVAVSLTPGGRLEVRAASAGVGRILDAAGAPYLFSIGSLDGRLPLSPPVAALDHVAPGSYRLVVGAPDGEKSYAFTIAEGQTTRLDTP